MSSIKDLRHKEFIGRIIPKGSDKEFDQKMKGRYRVHIPDLMAHIEEDKGIWCKNHVHNWRMTSSDVGEYGSHYPLHSGTYVIVKFFENDYNTGYIDRILSDYEDNTDKEAQDCVEVKPALSDRDEQYVIFKTPKKWNIFYVNEDTENEPNTMYLVFNRDNSPERRTVLRINESGIHIWTRNNQRIRIKEDNNIQIDGDNTEFIKGDSKSNIDGNVDLDIHGNFISRVKGDTDHKTKGSIIIEVEGTTNINSTGDVNVSCSSNVNVDASTINLNSGMSVTEFAAPPKEKTEVKDLGPGETLEYDTGVGDKCDDRTDNYNKDKKDFDLSMFKK